MTSKRHFNPNQFSMFTDSGEPTTEAAPSSQKVLIPAVEERLSAIGSKIRAHSSRADWSKEQAPYEELYKQYFELHNSSYPNHPITMSDIDRMYG